jgi:hypothetical protein
MLYDLSNGLDVLKLRARIKKIEQAINERKRLVIELNDKTNRTLSQNNYLHLIVSYFAAEYGETVEYVKQTIFKREVNPHIFVRTKHDKLLNRDVVILRSTKEISKEEMTEAIERFLNWSVNIAGIALPEPQQKDALLECQKVVEREKKYIN